MAHPLIVAPFLLRQWVEPRLPASVNIRWFASPQEAAALAPEAEIGWFDQFTDDFGQSAARAATRAKWINTIFAGLRAIPVEELANRDVIVTNGRGLNSANVADYAVMGMLSMAKGLAGIVRAHDRQNWLREPPGTMELEGSQALIIGYGSIGQAIGARLRAFGVTVTGVRRSRGPEAHVVGPDEWRTLLPRQDWIILAAPQTSGTRAMVGEAELALCRRGAGIVNVGRGELIDQVALIDALESGWIGGAFLDVTIPEPLPTQNPLWRAPNCIISMHMSGRSQTSMFRLGAERFVNNLERYKVGKPLEGVVDLGKGY